MKGILLSLTLLWWMVVVPVKLTAQSDGFISIDCGGAAAYTDTAWTNITWDTDRAYISTGRRKDVDPKNNYDNYNWKAVHTIRHFPDRKKNCYVLPVEEKARYLIRAMFYLADFKFLYPGAMYRFNISVDTNLWRTIIVTNSTAEGLAFEESIVIAAGSTLSVCLIDIGEGEPFISSLELRPLRKLYDKMAGDNFLVLLHRIDCSGYEKPPIRYPDDPFDRLWRRHDMDTRPFNFQSKYPFSNVSTNVTPVKAYEEYPPMRVMETAWSDPDMKFKMFPSPSERSTKLDTTTFLSMFHMWDFEEGIVGPRRFSIYLDDESLFEDVLGNNTLLWKNHTRKNKEEFINGVWRINSTSKDGAILNAAEFYAVYPRASFTNDSDATAVSDLQQLYLITDTSSAWTGDPCQPVPWDWLECDTTKVPPRVTHVNLSRVFNEFNNSALTLPSTFKDLTAITHLSLDNNNLKGEIPDLSFLTELQVLHLEGNRLTGSIPPFLTELPNLTELYLQNNNLSGWVPGGLNKPGLKFLAGCNPLLQGLTKDTSGCNVASPNHKTLEYISISTMYILIFLLGGALLLGLVLLLVFAFRTCYLRRKEKDRCPDSGSTLKPPQEYVRCFTLDEMTSATNNFDSDRLLGEGGFGRVYYGRLVDGSEVAVKVRSECSHQGADEFYNEVNLLSRAHHRNLLSLVGYCKVDLQQILVYPFMPGKTLQDHLRGNASLLHWQQRLEIALDAARGLCYLHKDCSPVIVHRDVKSSNILLDDQLRGKLSDFGISKSSETDATINETTRVIGTRGYLDPDFGVVLLEIITGRSPINSLGPIDRVHWHLIDWAEELLQGGDITIMVDAALGESYNKESMRRVAELAIQSVQPTRSMRIGMEAVVTGLTEALAIERQSSTFPVQENDQEDRQTSSTHNTYTRDHWQSDLENYSRNDSLPLVRKDLFTIAVEKLTFHQKFKSRVDRQLSLPPSFEE